MGLTAKKAIDISIELWTWLAETGAKEKKEWPQWEKYGKMMFDCPLCEYSSQRESKNKRAYLIKCLLCPYYKQFGRCIRFSSSFLYFGISMASPSYYEEWAMARTRKARKKYARLFLGQLKELRRIYK